MIKEFYKKALPSTGVYCIATIDPITKKPSHKFVESIEDLESFVESKKDTKTNIFVAMSSFKGYSRKADEAKAVRSFFVDLDVGEGKGYDSKEDALDAIDKFIEANELPPPVRIDSGGGVHAYWLFDQDVPADEWKPYAEKFKTFCLSNGLNIDPVVTADLARILRCPNTFNQKTDPPIATKVLDKEMHVYSFEEFKNFLGEVIQSQDELIASLPKGPISEEQRKASKLDNYESKFSILVDKSLRGEGCNQIKFIVENKTILQQPIWWSGLSIAQHCSDRDSAIRLISEGHPTYNEKEAFAKAASTQRRVDKDGKIIGGPHTCKTFEANNTGGCNGCSFKNKVNTPITLGNDLQKTPPSDNAVVSVVDDKTGVVSTQLKTLPQELTPFVYGKNGGIYYMAEHRNEHGDVTGHTPILVSLYDIYPVKRIYSVSDGECLLMKAKLPNDPEREFLLPIKHVYAIDRFREIITSIGIYYDPQTKQGQYLMTYIIRWGSYLMNKNSAEIMRMQMGWTPGRASFVVGGTEYLRDGTDVSSPTSPLCRGIAKHLQPMGTFEAWKEAADKLNLPSLELHAFTMLAGMGSALMDYTSTSGVTLCLTGESGAAKTGALYSALSVWGNPKDLSVLEATENGMTGRYLGLHNIPFGLDEVGNILPKTLSQLIHKISQGKSKIRMQASVNAERDHEMSASLVAIFTSNQSLYDKLTTLKKDPNGEVARLIEMMVRKPDIFKDDAHLGREIFDQFRFNYGWAGPMFIKAVYKTGEQGVGKLLDQWCLRFKKDFGEDTAYRFYENVVAVAMASGEISNAAGITKFDLDRVYKRIVGEMIAIRDNVVKVNSVNYESILSDYINRNQSGILAFKDNKITMEPRMALVIRVENDVNMMYISKTEFDKYLTEGGVSTKEFLFQINALGIKVDASRSAVKRMSSGWKDIGKSVTRVYKIDLTTMPNVHLGDEDNAE
jgi:hypothetical protein